MASEILNYSVVDRYSKKIGKVTDLLINSNSHLIEYLIVKKDWLIPVSLINSDDSNKQEIIVSQTKDRIMQVSSQKTSFPLEKCNHFSNIKKSVVYDITGSELGSIADVAYHPGLRVDFLLRKEGARFLFPNYYVIPDACIGQCYKQSIVLGVPKDELSLVNYSGFHHLFLPYQIPESKKRYVIVEAPVTTVRHYLDQRDEVPKKASESESLFIEELNVTKDIKVRQFVKLFNLILATSPDTYIPLSQEDAKKYFKQGTFIATEHYQPIGYCTVSIE